MNREVSDSSARTPPRKAIEIRKQLGDLEIVRKAADAYGTPDFASKLGMQSICLHQAALEQEVRAAEMLESGADVEIVLDGDPVVQHTIQAGFLGNFLSKIQHLVNAMAQTFTTSPTTRAPLPRNIVTENRLMVRASFIASSFGVRCTLPTKEDLNQLYEIENQRTIQSVAELLSDNLPSASLTNLVSHARVKKHYFELLELLAKNGADVRVRTRENPYGSKLHTRNARERVEWLELLSTDEERNKYIGIMVGGSVETGKFELKVSDELISGKVTDAAKNELRRITFGALVEAEVSVTTTTHEEGAFAPKVSYLLISVNLSERPREIA